VSLVVRAEVAYYPVTETPPTSVTVEEAQKGARRVFLGREGGVHLTPVYDRSLLANGHDLRGPALIESEQTTLLVPPGWRMRVDRYNNAVLEEGF